MLQQRKRLLIEKSIIATLTITFVVCSFLFVVIRSNIFPIINALIFLSSIVLFRGKYSILAIIFFSPFASSMTLMNSRIGSFKTWIVLFFLLYSLYTFIKTKGYNNSQKLKLLLCFGFVIIYVLISFLINLKTLSVLQTISALTYLSIPVSITLNATGQKKPTHLAITFALSIFISNFIAFSFLYIFKSNALTFLTNYAPSYVQYYKNYSLIQFRFPGLEGDPNVNSFSILLASSCLIALILKKKNIFLNLLLLIPLQVFAVLGQSKTYFLGIIVIIVAILIFMSKDKRRILLYFAFASLFLALSFSMAIRITSLNQTLLRFLFFDDRTGVIEGLTTERFHIWEDYFANMSNDPIKLLVGHGISAERLYGVDYHNVFVQLFWEFGLIGLIPFSIFIYIFFYIRNFKKNASLLFTFAIVVLFSLSIQVAYFPTTYIAFFISNLIINTRKSKGSPTNLCIEI